MIDSAETGRIFHLPFLFWQQFDAFVGAQ